MTSEANGSYFDRAYRDYWRQNPPRKLDHYMNMIESHVGTEKVRLIDLGCGKGAFLKRVQQHHPAWELVGVDVDADAVTAVRDLLPTVPVHVESVDSQPFAKASFDVATAWDVLEHIPRLDSAALAITGMLRPGGHFLFVVPVYDGVTGPIIRSLDRDQTHVHRNSRLWWLDWAANHFEILQWQGIYRYLVPPAWYVHVSTTRLRKHTPAVLVVCRKA